MAVKRGGRGRERERERENTFLSAWKFFQQQLMCSALFQQLYFFLNLTCSVFDVLAVCIEVLSSTGKGQECVHNSAGAAQMGAESSKYRCNRKSDLGVNLRRI